MSTVSRHVRSAQKEHINMHMGKDQYIQGMWKYFSCEGMKAKKFREEAEKEKQ